jgi:hypothetical protein
MKVRVEILGLREGMEGCWKYVSGFLKKAMGIARAGFVLFE